MITNSPQALFSLHGKHAVVTGGGSGLGFAIAQALALAGARLTLVGRRSEVLSEAVATIGDEAVTASQSAGVTPLHEPGDVAISSDVAGRSDVVKATPAAVTVATYACDLSEVDALDAHSAALMCAHGPADILVNAAGWRAREAATAVTPATWRATVDTNLAAPFFLARAFAPAMCERGWGRILNIASLQSRFAFAGGIAYGVSKGGVAQLTRAMAAEWSQHGVNANAIAPGFFPTNMTAPLFADEDATTTLAARTAIGRLGRLSDVAGVAIFLCAPASDYITGQLLYVDGGFSVR